MTHPVLAEIAKPDDYDELPEGLKSVYSREEFHWLTDAGKATLVQRECEPDWREG